MVNSYNLGNVHTNYLTSDELKTEMGFTKEQICNMAENQVNKWIKNIEIK